MNPKPLQSLNVATPLGTMVITCNAEAITGFTGLRIMLSQPAREQIAVPFLPIVRINLRPTLPASAVALMFPSRPREPLSTTGLGAIDDG